MNEYAYQIQGAIEDAKGKFQGFLVVVCTADKMDQVSIPAAVFDRETISFLEFRLKLTKDPMNIQRLPFKVQNKIRVPLGKWLDRWVLKNFYGDSSDKQSINP